MKYSETEITAKTYPNKDMPLQHPTYFISESHIAVPETTSALWTSSSTKSQECAGIVETISKSIFHLSSKEPYLGIVNFVLMQDLITQLLIHMRKL